MSIEDADATQKPSRSYCYDAFLSFRGSDTRFTFMSDLYKALVDKGITPFLDDGDILIGASITDTIFKAIEESNISIVVISNTYAFSEFCLDELVKIIECMEKLNRTVYPIFYQVDPSDVRLQRGSFEIAMVRHEERFGRDSEKVRNWRSALSKVATIAGWVYRVESGYEHDFVQKFVGWVVQHSYRYDVFLSFRGEDTGYAFAGNLYNALCQKKIKTFFINDEQWKQRDQISPAFRKAIENSRISIVVLSKNYASSTWCLDELANIIECTKMKNQQQRVWPIFYKVEPSDVRRQKNDYGVAMDVHESELGNESTEVQKWRSALFEVANLTGFTFGTGYEYELIQKIVESSVQSLSRYDVFLSFSWEDTRYTFSGYLYNVMRQKGYKIFMDDEGLEGGIQISQTPAKAIEDSRHAIIVFSKNYGYSPWCLDELVKILECKKKKNLVIWPIFYRVEPLDVRYQRNSYGDAMIAHEKRFGKDSEKVQKWRSALSKVTDLGGYQGRAGFQVTYKVTEHEHELIKQIMEHLRYSYIQLEDPFLLPSTTGFTIGLQHPNG